MARTYDEVDQLIEDNAVLQSLSTSAVARWFNFKRMAIVLFMAIEEIFELFKSDTDNALATKQHGSEPWFPIMVKAFQYGDSLTVEKGVTKYATIDESKQIIKQVSFNKNRSGRVTLKVAKDDGSGNLIALTTDEYNAFDDYVKRRVSPGVPPDVFSLSADIVKYTLTAKFDPSYNRQSILDAIDEVLVDYRDKYRFGAVFYKSAFMAAVKGVEGVVSVTGIIDMTLKNGTETVNDLLEEKELPAGYFNYDGASSIQLISI